MVGGEVGEGGLMSAGGLGGGTGDGDGVGEGAGAPEVSPSGAGFTPSDTGGRRGWTGSEGALSSWSLSSRRRRRSARSSGESHSSRRPGLNRRMSSTSRKSSLAVANSCSNLLSRSATVFKDGTVEKLSSKMTWYCGEMCWVRGFKTNDTREE